MSEESGTKKEKAGPGNKYPCEQLQSKDAKRIQNPEVDMNFIDSLSFDLSPRHLDLIRTVLGSSVILPPDFRIELRPLALHDAPWNSMALHDSSDFRASEMECYQARENDNLQIFFNL